ncbi:MAG: aminoglycoside phosphotransferase family protein [Planctomycetes bacterium]|nr:aminoglycoside phosphotransferase family protein [Planctomycetota bacterium]
MPDPDRPDGLDIERPEALVRYLRAAKRIAADERLEIRVLAGGVSNRTVWVRRAGGEAWVLKQALAKLRVQADWFSDPARIHREAEGLRWLERLAPAGTITPLVFEDPAAHLLAMAAVPKPHENWKTMLLAGRVENAHVDAFAGLLATVQRRAHERERDVRAAFGDRSFFESLRLEPYYTYAAQQVPEAADFLHALIEATRKRTYTLVHGDYSPKNVLVRGPNLVLLDHEVIHFGDGAFDLGFALTHFLSKAHHLPAHRGAFVRAAGRFWTNYRNAVEGLPFAGTIEPAAVRHTLGCLLARVAGRSPLEYLAADERDRQRRAVVNLMRNKPPDIATLAQRFAADL